MGPRHIPGPRWLARIGVLLALAGLMATCGHTTDATPVMSVENTSPVSEPPAASTMLVPSAPVRERAPSANWQLEAGTWVATAVVDRVEAFADPSDTTASWSFIAPDEFGQPRVFLVLDASPTHFLVQIPIRPNETEAWIARDDVTLSEVTTRALVDLRDNSVTVWDGDEVIVRSDAAVGKAATPTPLGRFFVRDVLQMNPSGAYGSFILGLSGFSETLDTFNGGQPVIAIHGTNRPDLVGREVSNGCVRVPNEVIELLAETVPLGTPVDIVA